VKEEEGNIVARCNIEKICGKVRECAGLPPLPRIWGSIVDDCGCPGKVTVANAMRVAPVCVGVGVCESVGKKPQFVGWSMDQGRI